MQREAHAEGADDVQNYIALEKVKLQRKYANSEWA